MTLAARLRDNLRDNKALYTVAGAGDLAVEKLREVPEQVSRLRENVTRYQDEVRENVTRYQGEVRQNLTKLQGDFRENVLRLQEEVRGNVTRLQERIEVRDLPGAARAYMAHFSSRTAEVLDELAERGRKVVARIEQQDSTRELQAAAKTTRRRARSTVTEAKKTARAASRATGGASKKVGD